MTSGRSVEKKNGRTEVPLGPLGKRSVLVPLEALTIAVA